MPTFRAQLAVIGDLRLPAGFEHSGYQFSPTSEGFNLAFQVEAGSIDEARSLAVATTRLFTDTLTFRKGTSLSYHLMGIIEQPARKGQPQTVALGFGHVTATAHIVVGATQDDFESSLMLTARVRNHPKSELLTRCLRWYARGIRDSDNLDRFVDSWIALEALANSYEGNVEPDVRQCGRVIRSRPVNGLMRTYLRSLGMNDQVESISRLSTQEVDCFIASPPPRPFSVFLRCKRF